MKIIRDRAEAYWLPDRFRYALFRLVAYWMYRATPRVEKRVAYGVDRDQTAVENYIVSIWLTVSTTAFIYGALERVMFDAIAALLAPFVMLIFFQVMILWSSLGPRRIRWNNRVDLNSFLTMFFVTGAAIYYASLDNWISAVAWFFLGGLGLNAVASVAAAMLRSRMDACTTEVMS